MAKQFTVRLKNEPGALGRLTGLLGQHGIDIRTIAAGAVGSSGMVVLSTSNDAQAGEVLRQAHYLFVEGETMQVGVEDRPGALAALTARLAEAGVNISGLMLLGRHQGKAEMGITVDNPEAARRALGSQTQFAHQMMNR